MSDLPGAATEIITPPLPPNVASVQYPQNDTGEQTVEIEQAEPLSEFAFFLRNINEGFHTTVQSQLHADGTFLNTESELTAVANWDQWQHNPILPEIISSDVENMKATIAEFESKLQKIRSGVLDKNGNKQYLHYADISRLLVYFKNKYPEQSEHINKTFENFYHDINFISSGISSGFSTDKQIRELFKDYRHSSMLLWTEELIELAAQTIENKPVYKTFNPIKEALQIKDVFDIVSKEQQAKFTILITRDQQAAPLEDIQFVGNPLDIKRILKNLLRYPQEYANNHKDLPVQQEIIFSKTKKGNLVIQSIDTAGGFVNGNERLIEDVRPAPTEQRPDLTKQLAFVREEKGENSVGSGFGLDMVWDTVVNNYNGSITVRNDTTPNGPDGAITTGSRFTMVLKPR